MKDKPIPDVSFMPLKHFLSFGISIANALNELHKNDRIHGAIRPDNITWESEKLKITLSSPTSSLELTPVSLAMRPQNLRSSFFTFSKSTMTSQTTYNSLKFVLIHDCHIVLLEILL